MRKASISCGVLLESHNSSDFTNYLAKGLRDGVWNAGNNFVGGNWNKGICGIRGANEVSDKSISEVIVCGFVRVAIYRPAEGVGPCAENLVAKKKAAKMDEWKYIRPLEFVRGRRDQFSSDARNWRYFKIIKMSSLLEGRTSHRACRLWLCGWTDP